MSTGSGPRRLQGKGGIGVGDGGAAGCRGEAVRGERGEGSRAWRWRAQRNGECQLARSSSFALIGAGVCTPSCRLQVEVNLHNHYVALQTTRDI